MYISRVIIENFKCFSGTFKLKMNKGVNILVGDNEAGKSTIQKCIIACPASLVKNWANELVKWLGEGAVTPFAIDGKATKEELTMQLKQWAMATGRAVARPVLIVSYESLRLNIEELKDVKIGLMLCDEAIVGIGKRHDILAAMDLPIAD